ncbi:MAG: hypothetical protein PHR65_04925 [Syntrophomonadaceae bacterium]|nr:hypothetical protein [Syntrophomonadaceae bacterium]
MERKAQYEKRLKNELSEVGSEIEKLIVRLDKLSVEIKQGYEEIENALLDKQSLVQPKLRESSMSGYAAWDLVWDNVWDAVKEFNRKATTDIKQNYKELEPALQAKQSALQSELDVSKMSGYEVWSAVWNEVWNDVWGVIEVFNRKASIEIKQVGEELQALLVKQSALQSELHELLMSWDKPYNLLKGVTNAMVKGISN